MDSPVRTVPYAGSEVLRDMPTRWSPADIATGRPVTYEWEYILDDVLDRLGRVEGAAAVAGVAYTYAQIGPGAVWVIDHRLGYNPGGIVVTSDDGYMLDGFGVQYLVTGQTLRLSFDISVAGVAYIS